MEERGWRVGALEGELTGRDLRCFRPGESLQVVCSVLRGFRFSFGGHDKQTRKV